MLQVLILGDSLVAEYDWQSRMPMYQINNLGVPGAVSADLLDSLGQVTELQKYADVILITIGTNDLLQDDLEFPDRVKRICVNLHAKYPNAEIIVTGLLPMELPHLQYNTIPNLNAELESFTMQTGCCFMDINKKFTLSPRQIFQDDGVHITEAAYEIWSRYIIEHIAFLIEDD